MNNTKEVLQNLKRLQTAAIAKTVKTVKLSDQTEVYAWPSLVHGEEHVLGISVDGGCISVLIPIHGSIKAGCSAGGALYGADVDHWAKRVQHKLLGQDEMDKLVVDLAWKRKTARERQGA
jgi:hypothetical protein